MQRNLIKIRIESFLKIALIQILMITFFAACTGLKTSLNSNIHEIRPGVLEGYLLTTELPTSVVLLPPPAEENSKEFEFDQFISRKYMEPFDSAKWKQAKQDANLFFPEALQSFSEIVEINISDELTPNLYMLLFRSMTDAAYSTYTAKIYYKRPRTFTVNGKPSCTPKDEKQLEGGGAYPSGHAAIGWAWALILSEIFPEHTNKLLIRGREFGESRIICNVHWHSDVQEGRFMGSATVARLHANKTFLADISAAKREVMKLKNN